MAQNVIIAGAQYNNVPSVQLNTTDGDTALFIDTVEVNTIIDEHNSNEDAHKYIQDMIPTKVSQLENDNNYLISHQDISGKADKNNILSFSTDEQRIGTWINGKPIYRKTIVYNVSNLSQTNYWAYYPADTNDTSISSLNIEQYVNVNGITSCTNQSVQTESWQPIPRVCPDANENYNIGIGDLNQKRIGVLFGNKYNNATIYFTIEYTKTTD